MTLKVFGSESWNMQGQIRLKADVVRRNARMRLREKYLASFKQLFLPSGEEKAFAEMLDKNFTFVADDSGLSGETHFWKIEEHNVLQQLPPTIAARAPTAAAGASTRRRARRRAGRPPRRPKHRWPCPYPDRSGLHLQL
jgi:hypothetical protein